MRCLMGPRSRERRRGSAVRTERGALPLLKVKPNPQCRVQIHAGVGRKVEDRNDLSKYLQGRIREMIGKSDRDPDPKPVRSSPLFVSRTDADVDRQSAAVDRKQRKI